MKFPLLLLFSSALFGLSSVAQAQISSVTVRVEQATKPEGPVNLKDKFTKNQKHSLRVFVSNGTHEEISVKVKFSFFGHAVDSHDLVTVDSGEQEATIKASETQEVEHYPRGRELHGRSLLGRGDEGWGKKGSGHGK